MKNLSRGTLLKTRVTEKWTKEEIACGEEIERALIFTEFHRSDRGSSRQVVCQMNRNHPDYELYARLIARSVDMFHILERLNRGDGDARVDIPMLLKYIERGE